VDEADLKASHGVAVAESEGPGFFKRVADGADTGAFAGVKERPSDAGQDVGVLVGIDVGDVDAGALKVLDLRQGFDGDLVFADFAEEDCGEEVDEGRTEVFAVGSEECRDALGV